MKSCFRIDVHHLYDFSIGPLLVRYMDVSRTSTRIGKSSNSFWPMADPPSPPTLDDIIRQRETRKDKFTHKVLRFGRFVDTDNGERYEIQNVVKYGEYGDLYTVLAHDGTIHHMITESIKAPKGYQMFSTVAALFEEILVSKEANVKKHFLMIENCKCDRNFNYVFTPQYGPTISEVRRYHVGTNFPVGDALAITIRCFFAVEYLHSMGYVHGDLTLSSFSFGMGKCEENVYLTHFGRLKKHIDVQTGLPFQKRPRAAFMGRDIVYAPRSAHRRKDYGRGDDLESWLFISSDIFYDANPPWKPKRRKDLQDEDSILQRKEEFLAGNKALQTAFFMHYPAEFVRLVPIIYSMDYSTVPNYDAFKFVFQEVKRRIGGPVAQKWKGLSDLSKYPRPKRPINKNVRIKKKKSKENSQEEIEMTAPRSGVSSASTLSTVTSTASENTKTSTSTSTGDEIAVHRKSRKLNSAKRKGEKGKKKGEMDKPEPKAEPKQKEEVKKKDEKEKKEPNVGNVGKKKRVKEHSTESITEDDAENAAKQERLKEALLRAQMKEMEDGKEEELQSIVTLTVMTPPNISLMGKSKLAPEDPLKVKKLETERTEEEGSAGPKKKVVGLKNVPEVPAKLKKK